MDEKIGEAVKRLIEEQFYYVQYPKAQETSIWVDRDGRVTLIDKLDSDHLERCIHLVERDILNFKKTWKSDMRYAELEEIIITRAEALLSTMKSEFRSRADNI
jgi:hypothetical protein